MSRILAFDLGGSSLRLALVEPDGRFSGMVRRPVAIEHPAEGQFEADPRDWWDAFEKGCAELAGQGHDFADVTAVAGCGFTRTQVFLDQTGASIRPALTFQDSRAAEVLDRFRASASPDIADALQALTPFDPLSRLLWLCAFEPDNLHRLRWLLEPKDYLNFCLTGVPASDGISQMPMVRNLAAGLDPLLSALDLRPDFLPKRMAPQEVIGTVREGLQYPLSGMAGIPVYCGAFDTWCNVLGSGAMKAGAAYTISGTSDVSGVLSHTQVTAPGLPTVDWGSGLWQLGGPSQGAASRLDWALDRFFPDQPRQQALNRALERDGAAPLFLPYLDGERAPLWQAELRGAFLGLNSLHDNADLVRGAAEGINYLSRDILERAAQVIGDDISHVSFSGGLSSNPALCQLKADILGRPVQVPKNSETGLVGAARIPGMSGTQAGAGQGGDHTYQPDARRKQYHDRRFRVFREASSAMGSWSRDLV